MAPIRNKLINEDYGAMLHRLFPPKKMEEMHVGGNHVRTITLQVTEDCNLRCTYCYQHNKTPLRMTPEIGKKFIDLILASDERSEKYIKSRECAGVIFDFIGGEPFLEIDLIDELSDYIIRRMVELDHPWATRYRFSICTNGVLYFEPKVQEYLKKHSGHVSLTVTIDGNKKIHDTCRLDAAGNGTYDRAWAAQKHWCEHYLGTDNYPGTKITISPENLPCISEAVIGLLGEGYEDININCVYENVWQKEHATKLYYQLKNIANYILENDLQDKCRVSILSDPAGTAYGSNHTWCGGSGLMIGVDPRGDIYPCIRYMPNSVGDKVPHYIIGDVDHGFIYNEEQEQRLKCMACITRRSQCEKTEHCLDCPIAMGCGDCAAYSYEVYGEVGYRTTFHCDMHKARVLAQIYYKNLAMLKTGKMDILPVNIPRDWALEIIPEDEFDMLNVLALRAELLSKMIN